MRKGMLCSFLLYLFLARFGLSIIAWGADRRICSLNCPAPWLEKELRNKEWHGFLFTANKCFHYGPQSVAVGIYCKWMLQWYFSRKNLNWAAFFLPDVKSNYLKGLSHILNHLPKPVLVTELPTVSMKQWPRFSTCWGFLKSTCIIVKEMWPFSSLLCPFPQLLPLLLESLSCSDHVVQLSTLHCVQPLLLDAPHVMRLHIDTLVDKFLNLTDNSAMVRRVVFPFSDYFLLFYLEEA